MEHNMLRANQKTTESSTYCRKRTHKRNAIKQQNFITDLIYHEIATSMGEDALAAIYRPSSSLVAIFGNYHH